MDIACGPGRHALLLARLGYQVVGIDNNKACIQEAAGRRLDDASFHVMDMRDLSELVALDITFDGALSMWQSFGYFDDGTNLEILRGVSELLRPGGRAVFDLYNGDHAVLLASEAELEQGSERVRVTRTWNDRRMAVEVDYPSGGSDRFEWRIYTPPEFEAIAAQAGLLRVLACCRFDEQVPPTPDQGRMQFVLEKGSR